MNSLITMCKLLLAGRYIKKSEEEKKEEKQRKKYSLKLEFFTARYPMIMCLLPLACLGKRKKTEKKTQEIWSLGFVYPHVRVKKCNVHKRVLRGKSK